MGIIVILLVSLLIGVFVLIGQNGGIGAIGANLSRAVAGSGSQWVQIQPRTAGIAENDAIQPDQYKDDGSQITDSDSKAKKVAVVWCNPAVAANNPKGEVIIGEIAWMGTAVSYSDEWIELRNISVQNVDLAGWQLQNKNQKIRISFSASDNIGMQGVYLLERTGDDTIPEMSANKIYTGSIANSNEALYLFDADCNIQDLAVAASKWPAGDNGTKQTMERLDNLGWANSKIGGGTPGK